MFCYTTQKYLQLTTKILRKNSSTHEPIKFYTQSLNCVQLLPKNGEFMGHII